MDKLRKLPKGKLRPVVLRKEVVEVEKVVTREVEKPVVYNQSINPADIITALKSDPTFLERVKGERGEKGEQGQPGIGAGGEGASQQKPSVNYIPVRGSSYTLTKDKLIPGQNIIGVNYDGPVTIYLPKKISSQHTIYVNDESGNASTNNITIKMIS